MKLRNKKTGEIKDIEFNSLVSGNADCCVLTKGEPEIYTYTSLAELNEEWEDYEEPKDRWYINENGGVLHYVPDDPEGEDLVYNKYQDDIGNYFETKEEAEKAVEKLKAWKRLKDRGFKFGGYTALGLAEIHFMLDWEDIDVEQHKKDMDLLFGGEE